MKNYPACNELKGKEMETLISKQNVREELFMNQAEMHYLSRVMIKPGFCICENKDADQLRGTAKLISAFIFNTRIVQSIYFLNPKFHGSSHLLWLYSPVCVGQVKNPENRFSHNEAHLMSSWYLMYLISTPASQVHITVKVINFWTPNM